MASPAVSPTASRIVRGRVMHRRHEPVENRFVYPVFFLLLDLDELDALGSPLFGVNRWRPLAFHFADHANGSDPRVWVREKLARAGIRDCSGPIRVQTFPRVFGYVFNPVSFWYCHRPDGTVGAIIAEVNNTFGDRHCYLLRPDERTGGFAAVRADKRFYVSPFYPVRGEYVFRFNTDFDRPRATIDYFDDGRPQLNTSLWGESRPFSHANLFLELIRQPLLTVGVIVHIHWQALRLWRKGVTFFHRPSASAEETSS
jgi:uncharacterized protein